MTTLVALPPLLLQGEPKTTLQLPLQLETQGEFPSHAVLRF